MTDKITRRKFLIGFGAAFAGVFGWNLYSLNSGGGGIGDPPRTGNTKFRKHRRDGNCVEKLVELVPPPKEPIDATEEVLDAKERELGIKFPPDYRKLFLLYGVGCFMFKPNEGEYYLDIFDIVDPKGGFDCLERSKFYDSVSKSFRKNGLEPVLPEGFKLLGADPGLVPFGFIDGDMEWFFWLTKGSPDKWPIFVDAGRNGIGKADELDITTACLILELVENGLRGNHLQRDVEPVKYRRGRDRWWRGESLWETGYVGAKHGVDSLWIGNFNGEPALDKYIACKKDKDDHIIPSQPNQFMREFGINWYDHHPLGHQFIYSKTEKPVDGFFKLTNLAISNKAIVEAARKKNITKVNSAILIHNWDYESINAAAKKDTTMEFIGVFPSKDIGTIYSNRGPFFYHQKLDETN